MKEEGRQGAGRNRDISSKKVLGNPILYAQFLRSNLKIPFLKNVRPEDIEDVSERYIPYLGTEFESDTVKRVHIHSQKGRENSVSCSAMDNSQEENSGQESFFLVFLTEHKSQVDYDVSMQLLKYMLCIWLDYEKEMEQKKAGASDRKSFRYPLIIPVVYYEGKAPWTADCRFRTRVFWGEQFREWIPDFTYEVVRLHDYSNEELLARGDEMSLIMLFNKIQDTVDLSEFLKLPREKLNDIVKDTPEAILDIIASVMESLCVKIGATEEEMQECVSRVKERTMEREIDLKQISDGKRYSANDMAKTGCNDCAGCSQCCRGMGNSIILDPYDIYCLEAGLKLTFEELMRSHIELNVVDGIILPNLKMQEKDCCGFLDERGRCSIHDFRPGFCRMFPLGRIYEDGGFQYFLQVHECPHPGKTKVKVKKWLGVPQIERYEAYVKDWHYFLKDVQAVIRETESDEMIKSINMFLLNGFFVKPYESLSAQAKEAEFYGQFYERLKEAGERMDFYR